MTKKQLQKEKKRNAIKALFSPCKVVENQFLMLLNKWGVNPIELRKIAKG